MPEENPAPTPAPEATPTVTPEPAAPAPAPAAPAAPVTPAEPKKSHTGLIVSICAVAAIAIVGTVVAIILINNNKPKEPTVDDLLNSIFKTDDSKDSKSDSGSSLDWGSLFDDDDDYKDDDNDNDSDSDSDIDWSRLFESDDDDDDEEDEDEDYYRSSTSKNSSSKISSCKDAFDCMEKLDKGYTVAEIDKITGLKGEPAYEGSTSSYVWEYANGDKLKYYVSEYSLDVEVEYEKSNYKDSNVDLSGYKSLESDIRAGNVKYKDLVKQFGTEGKLFKRSEYRNGYFWVDSKGGYIEANVSVEDGQVQSAFGILR